MLYPSDKELIARVIATRDNKAFEALVRRHQHHVRNWLRQLVSDTTRADDIAQETFIKAWEKIHSFRFEAEFKSWLFGIGYNEFLQDIRKQKKDMRLLNKLKVLHTGIHEKVTTPQGELHDLPKLIAKLSQEEKACMILSYGFGYSNGEISMITSLPLGTVKSHIRRSNIKIKATFEFDE